MNEYLANGLRYPEDEWVSDVFCEGFQTAAQWINFLKATFPGGSSAILDKKKGWAKSEFQALYIACWIYKPVVKGSYMLYVPEDHIENVEHAYNKKKFGTRWTSHLHKENKGKDMSDGWAFLKHYHELLVQLEPTQEGTYLFLKCEGYPSYHHKHIKSWRHKEKHGVGLEVNEELLQYATDERMNLGISPRSAENYSKNYKTLLKTLGSKEYIKKHGEIIDVRTAVAMILQEICNRLYTDIQNPNLAAWLDQNLRLFSLSRQSGIDRNIVDNLSSGRVAKLIEVIVLFADHAYKTVGLSLWSDPFLRALLEAKSDLRRIQQQLVMDQSEGRRHTTRYFEEVNLTPKQLDLAIENALELLAQPKL